MPSFSTIAQDPTIRDLVQTNTLVRQFKDALFPDLVFRTDSDPELWPGQVGDEMIWSSPGLISPSTKPLKPRIDPQPVSYSVEQWSATLQQWAQSIDTHIPTSIQAVVDLFMRNAHQMGMAGAQSINRVARAVLYNAAVSGQTVADGAGVASTSLRVKFLNGFTRARRPDLAAGSKVRFREVSSSNPLAITVGGTANTVIGYTSDDPDGDEFGPGVLTLSAADTWSDRDAVLASDKTVMVRVGGGDSVDSISTSDLPRLADVEAAVARMSDLNVRPYPDGRFHAHVDSTSISKMFQDDDLKRLNQSLPDYYMYKKMALGEILNTIFVKNAECPRPDTVASDETNLALEMTNATSVSIRRILFTGHGLLKEYYNDQSSYLTDAGMTGKLATPQVTNDGIEVNSDRISLIFRAAQNRLQDEVACSYRFVGSFVARTDSATGDAARYKRCVVIEHGL